MYLIFLLVGGVQSSTLYKWIVDSKTRFNYDPNPNNMLGNVYNKKSIKIWKLIKEGLLCDRTVSVSRKSFSKCVGKTEKKSECCLKI